MHPSPPQQSTSWIQESINKAQDEWELLLQSSHLDSPSSRKGKNMVRYEMQEDRSIESFVIHTAIDIIIFQERKKLSKRGRNPNQGRSLINQAKAIWGGAKMKRTIMQDSCENLERHYRKIFNMEVIRSHLSQHLIARVVTI